MPIHGDTRYILTRPIKRHKEETEMITSLIQDKAFWFRATITKMESAQVLKVQQEFKHAEADGILPSSLLLNQCNHPQAAMDVGC